MEEIEVGEYVRTKEGLIEKIKEFIPHYTKGKREGQEVKENYLMMGQEQCKFIESIDYRIPPCYPSDEEWEKIKKTYSKTQQKLNRFNRSWRHSKWIFSIRHRCS